MRDQQIDLVVTASPGGNLYEGLQIAAILQDNSIGTFVPEGASCESSCANIFLGGFRRLLVGELGVHQFYTGGPGSDDAVRKDVATAATQYTTADIIGIMNQFDTPPFVYEKMFGTEEIYYFKASEKPRLNRQVEDEPFADRVGEVEAFLANNPDLLKVREPSSPPAMSVTAAAPAAPSQPAAVAGTDRMIDVDFFGMDLSPTGYRDVSIEACNALCRQNPSCAAWSYVVETRWCWPKSGVENFSLAPGTISQVVDLGAVSPSIFDRPFVEVTGKDVVGYDIFPRGLKDTSLVECRKACELSASCQAFTWLTKKNWCFPKFGYGVFRDQLGTVSGIKNSN